MLLARERLHGLREQRVLPVVQHDAQFVPHAASAAVSVTLCDLWRAVETYLARMKTRRASSAAIVAWSFSIAPVSLSTSCSWPSFCACRTVSSLCPVVSTRLRRRSTRSGESRSWRMKRSRIAI